MKATKNNRHSRIQCKRFVRDHQSGNLDDGFNAWAVESMESDGITILDVSYTITDYHEIVFVVYKTTDEIIGRFLSGRVTESDERPDNVSPDALGINPSRP